MESNPKWLERAKETYNFHRSKLLTDVKWNMAWTARALRRSQGSICEDLLIARWFKTHGAQLEKFKHAYQALEFIRNKQREEELEELE